KLSMPLDVPDAELLRKVNAEGKLVLHGITTEVRGPIRQTMVKVLADMHGKKTSDVVRVVKNSEVRFRIADGNVYHEGLSIGFPALGTDLQITSRGSVGLDESLDLHVELPRLDKEKQKEKGSIHCRITGTINKPELTVRDASLVVRLDDRPKPILDVEGINLTFRVEASKDGPLLSLAPVTLFSKQKLTPELAHEVMQLVVPTLGDVADVRGEFSLSLDKFRTPLGA